MKKRRKVNPFRNVRTGRATSKELVVHLFGPEQREFDPDGIGFLVKGRTGEATNRWADGTIGIPEGAISFIEEASEAFDPATGEYYDWSHKVNPGAKWHLIRALDLRRERHKASTAALRDRYAGQEAEHKLSQQASSVLGMPNPAKVKCDKCGKIVDAGDFDAQIDHMYTKHGAKSDSEAGHMARMCFELVTKNPRPQKDPSVKLYIRKSSAEKERDMLNKQFGGRTVCTVEDWGVSGFVVKLGNRYLRGDKTFRNPRKLTKRSSKQSWTPIIALVGVGAFVYWIVRNKEV